VRVFLDTNVLVSAFAARGLCADLLELVLLEHDLVLGRNVLLELNKALRRKVRLPSARSAAIVDFVSGEAVQIVVEVAPSIAKVDPDDARVLGEAQTAEAGVFGDAALLKLGTVGTVRVVTPRQFWEMLQSSRR
jgi:predicted nucleic acid-binding protein